MHGEISRIHRTRVLSSGQIQYTSHLLCSPYDTLEEVIGMRGTPGHGSLMEWGIRYREMDLAPDGGIDWEALKVAIIPGQRQSVLVTCSSRQVNP